MVTGIDDEVTLRANRDGFLKFQLRPRRLVDAGTIDMTVEIFGAKYDSSIVIAPTGSNRAFHPDGELLLRERRSQATTCKFCRPSYHIDRGRDRRARRPGLVSALPDRPVGGGRSAGQAYGDSRVPCRRFDGRCDR